MCGCVLVYIAHICARSSGGPRHVSSKSVSAANMQRLSTCCRVSGGADYEYMCFLHAVLPTADREKHATQTTPVASGTGLNGAPSLPSSGNGSGSLPPTTRCKCKAGVASILSSSTISPPGSGYPSRRRPQRCSLDARCTHKNDNAQSTGTPLVGRGAVCFRPSQAISCVVRVPLLNTPCYSLSRS
jgi:hypothetical protein